MNLSRRGFLELTGLAGLGLAVAGSTAGLFMLPSLIGSQAELCRDDHEEQGR